MELELFKEQLEVLSQLGGKDSCLIIATTGSGKTLIALRHIQILLDSSSCKRGLFLAPTNILVDQHVQTFQKYSKYDIHGLKSGVKPDLSLEGIYVSTGHYAQIFTNTLPSDYFEVIYFDEAHKGLSTKSPYTKIAKKLTCKKFGVTASPGSDRNLKEILSNLQISTVVYGKSPYSYKKETTKIYIKNKEIITKTYDQYMSQVKKTFSKIYQVLRLPIHHNYLSYLIKNKNLVQDTLRNASISPHSYYLFFHLLYCGYLFYYECHDTLVQYCRKLKPSLQTSLRKYSFFKKLMDCKQTSGKFQYIVDNILSEQTTVSLIFFENYTTALSFHQYLLERGYSEDKIAVIAGKSKMTPKVRNLNIKKTYDPYLKVIIATSVIEEGVNVKGVDLVVFFKPIYNKIKIIQRTGRTGRYKDGYINVLCYERSSEY